MAKLQIITGNSLAQAAGITRYYCTGGELVASAIEAFLSQTWRTTGTFSNLYCRITANDRAESTLRLRVSAANGNQVVSIGASTTGEFEDTVNTDTNAATDEISYSLVTGAGGTTFTIGLISVLFAAGTNTVNRYAVTGSVITGTASVTRLFKLVGRMTGGTVESREQIKFKTAGTLKNMFVYISANARTTTVTLASRVNGADGNLAVSVGAGTTGIFEDTANSDAIAVDDLVCWRWTTDTGTENITIWTVGGDFETTDSSTMYIGGSFNGTSQNAAVSSYSPIGGIHKQTVTTEADAKANAGVTPTFSKLEINIITNTVTAASTLRLRVNGANGNQVATITASTTGWFEDASNTDVIAAATDELDWELATGATGTSLTMHMIGMKAAFALAGTAVKGMSFSPGFWSYPV